MLDTDNVVRADNFVVVVDHHTEIRIFANAGNVYNIVAFAGEGAANAKGDNLEIIGVDNRAGDAGDRTAGLDAEDGRADKVGICY